MLEDFFTATYFQVSISGIHFNFGYNGATNKNSEYLEKEKHLSLEIIMLREPKFTNLLTIFYNY